MINKVPPVIEKQTRKCIRRKRIRNLSIIVKGKRPKDAIPLIANCTLQS
jgi:hypothetical protein